MPIATVIADSPSLAVVVRLLEDANLPTADLNDADMEHFFFVGSPNDPAGIVGLQFFGKDALLRSLVVGAAHRSQGFGQRLVERAELHARQHGATTLYLLTTTAESFFLARGYIATPREHAPAAIRSTPEFAELCPASSAFLSKHVQPR